MSRPRARQGAPECSPGPKRPQGWHLPSGQHAGRPWGVSCPRKAPTGAAPGPALSMVNVPTEAPTARVTDAMSPTAMAPGLRLPGLVKSPGDAVPIPPAATIPRASSAATTPSGARVRLGVDLSEWPPPFSRACSMVPGPYMAYLDHGRPQDWSTFERTCGHTHEHTHTKAECPRAPSGRGRAASTTGRMTRPEILLRTMDYLFFSPPGWPVGALSVKTRPPGVYVRVYA